MEPLYNTFFRTNDQVLNDSIEAIISFPDDEPNAQIKANVNQDGTYGALGRADGSTWALNQLATVTGYATELPGTINAIKETFKKVADQFENDHQNMADISALKNDFQTELSMLKGLQNISKIYHERYDIKAEEKDNSYWGMLFGVDKGKKQGALSELDDTLRVYQERIRLHGEQFIALRDTYQGDLTQSIMNPRARQDLHGLETTQLDAYVDTWCPGISKNEAQKYINNGKVVLKGLLDGTITKCEHQEEVTAIMWHLMRRALDKHQGHSEGAFAIEDRDGRLYNFLESANSFDRESSHYVERCLSWTGVSSKVFKSSAQKGIDITTGKLPAEKRHVLFGQVDDNKLLFIKLENFGIGSQYDKAAHGAEFAIAQYNKIFYPGSDDLPEMAKERVPVAVIKAFTESIKLLSDENRENINNLMADLGYKGTPEKAAKVYGIAYMQAYMKAADLLTTPEGFTRVNFDNSIPKCADGSPLDHLEKRTGKEVYLTYEELL